MADETKQMLGVVHPDILKRHGLFNFITELARDVVKEARCSGEVIERGDKTWAIISTSVADALKNSLEAENVGRFIPCTVHINPMNGQVTESITITGFCNGVPASVTINRYGDNNPLVVTYDNFVPIVEDNGVSSWDIVHGLFAIACVRFISNKKREEIIEATVASVAQTQKVISN